MKNLVTISNTALNKINQILKNINSIAMLISIKGGG